MSANSWVTDPVCIASGHECKRCGTWTKVSENPMENVTIEMPIKGNALRLARQLMRWWLAGCDTITFEILSDRLIVKRSGAMGPKGFRQ